MTKLNINILESDNEISNRILKTLLPEISRYFNNAYKICKNNISNLVMEAITSAPEYQSLISGKLKYEFGLPDAASRLSNILTFWKNIEISFEKPAILKNEIRGSFNLSMIKADYTDVLALSDSVLVTEKGAELEWLKWLLLFGDKTIIKEYVIDIGPNPRSRTGNAVMVGQTKGRWSVPPEFAGTIRNNWITRAIDSIDNQVYDLIEKSLKV